MATKPMSKRKQAALKRYRREYAKSHRPMLNEYKNRTREKHAREHVEELERLGVKDAMRVLNAARKSCYSVVEVEIPTAELDILRENGFIKCGFSANGMSACVFTPEWLDGVKCKTEMLSDGQETE